MLSAERGLIRVFWLAFFNLIIGVRPCVFAPCVFAQGLPGSAPPSLKTVAVPKPPNLSEFIADEDAAILLGKALFWDIQVGSDGVACASCHFHAGADNR